MTLIIEDGSGVENANSYVSVAQAKAYAAARGVTLGSDAVVEQQLIKAMDFLEAFRSDFQGCKTDPAQPLQWPRENVYIDSELFLYDAIPAELKAAQCQLVIEQFNGVDLNPTVSGQFVVREKVGPIDTQYSEKIGSSGQPQLNTVNNFLAPLLNYNSSYLSTVRV